MKKILLVFSVCGLVSGILSFFSFALSLERDSESFISYLPGLIFGLTVSALLYYFFKRNILFHIFFLVVSTVAYYVALQTFFFFNNDNESTLPLFFAGLIGSSILIVALRLMYPLSINYIILVIVIGSLAGIPDPDIFRIFPLWQAAVATAIGYSLAKDQIST